MKPSEDDPPERGYVSEQVIWQRPELADQVVERAFRELRSIGDVETPSAA